MPGNMYKLPVLFILIHIPDASDMRIPYGKLKRTVDLTGSLLLAAAFAPAAFAAAIAIKAETPGNVIFIHERIGENGRRIPVYKFRSMHKGAEDIESSLNDEEMEAYYREYSLASDPRVTKSGRILRKTHMDELPQLFNIIQGEMSLVGPRPVTKDELGFYSDAERERLLSVKPGLTGYWQVFGKNRATYQNGERVRMELFYADHASAGLDALILLLTPASVLSSLIRGRRKTR